MKRLVDGMPRNVGSTEHRLTGELITKSIKHLEERVTEQQEIRISGYADG